MSRQIWARRVWRVLGGTILFWAALAQIAPDYFTVTTTKVAKWSPILGAILSAAVSLIDLRFLFPVAFLWVFVYLWRLENRIETLAARAPMPYQPPPAFVPMSGGLQGLIAGPKMETRECGAEDTLSDLDVEGLICRLEAAPTDLVRTAIANEYIDRCFMWDGLVERYSGAATSPVQITGRASPRTGLPLLTFEVAASRVAGLPTISVGDHVRIVGRIRSIDRVNIAFGGCRVDGPLRKPPP